MKILRIIAVVIFILSATASVNAGSVNTPAVTNVKQIRLPPPPARPPGPHVSFPRRRVVHSTVYRRRATRHRPFIRLPHIKLPPHPRGGPPRPPGF